MLLLLLLFLTEISFHVFNSGIVRREELFIVTKLPLFAMTPEDVPVLFRRSLADLGLDYIDLYLVHSPLGVEKNEAGDWIKFDKDGKVEVLQEMVLGWPGILDNTFKGIFTVSSK